MQAYLPSLRLWVCVVVFFSFSATAQTVTPAAPSKEATSPTASATATPAPAPATPAPIASVPAPSAAPVPTAEEEPPIECATCHKEQFDNMAFSRHGASGDSRTPWGKADTKEKRNEMCTACHGKADDHMGDPIDKKPETMFNKTVKSDDKNARCTTCHIGGNRMHWKGGTHESRGTACSDCHKVHIKKDPALVMETQPSVCFNCHKEIRSMMMRVSTHPLRSGQMACTSCHNPHGTISDSLMIKNTVNETCYTCHADKRGPFLWDHPPVRDSCVNCHNPHGTNNAPMLQVRTPYLCQQCHGGVQHPSSVYSGNNLPSNAAGDKMLAQGCPNCHIKVHGSNHPSGARFTR
ncbi:MAG: DmsE family decaheme c-type cytochrome [Burkholderiales bacterium]|nr:DmsE family decaheme c-type cytochrome [Burkholderiales bacterium]